MALTAIEKVYQADMQHITPSADAQIYGYGGDWILRGLNAELNGSNLIIHPGAAILQGRLYELSGDLSVDVSAIQASAGSVGLLADLTQTNTATANNQYTMVSSSTFESGNLLEGDLQAYIPIYRILGTSVYFNKFLYSNHVTLTNTVGGDLNLWRNGKSVMVQTNLHGAATQANAIIANAPIDFAPSQTIVVPLGGNNGLIFDAGADTDSTFPIRMFNNLAEGAYITSSGMYMTN